MKTLVLTLLSIVVTTASANASQFVCLSKNFGDNGQDYAAGTIVSNTSINSTNYGVRGATNGANNSVYIKNGEAEADTTYRPTKYKGFNRFYIGSYGSGNGAITMSILLPQNVADLTAGAKFVGYAYGQGVEGGGATQLSCIIK